MTAEKKGKLERFLGETGRSLDMWRAEKPVPYDTIYLPVFRIRSGSYQKKGYFPFD